MKIEQSSEKLVFRHKPVVMWFIGIVLFGVGLIMLYNSSVDGFVKLPPNSWLKPAFFVVSLIAVGLGIRMFVWHPLVTTTLDRPSQTVTVAKNSFYMRKENVFRFSNILAFDAEETPGEDGQPEYRLRMQVKNDLPVMISTVYLPTRKKVDGFAKLANDFLNS